MRRIDEGSRVPGTGRARPAAAGCILNLLAGACLAVLMAPAVSPTAVPGAAMGSAPGPFALSAQQAGAETQGRHPESEEAIGRLKSPWCPGLMLEVCPSYPAAAFRDTLRMMAHEGVPADSLVAWTLARHGDEWSALPEASGVDLVAWVIPPLAILLGLGVVVIALRHLRRRPDAPTALDDREISEDEERRIQEALQDLERS